MIVVLLGTSGSGKSTAMRRVMERLGQGRPVVEPPRRQPLYYAFDEPPILGTAVVGHYETACGGADTIHSMDVLFDLVNALSLKHEHVLLEGVLLYSAVRRFLDLPKDKLLVIGLTKVPLDVCAHAVCARRETKAEGRGVAVKPPGPNFEKNLLAKYRGTVTAMQKLEAAGYRVVRTDRDGALLHVLATIGLA